ncbi:UDP-galactose-4-epimerase [Planctomycetes bacterium Pan216]|uniref:UDP-galactose-4-epimerase n=1 Tax=Kolteria novifilia TaxID=2527975 RepID=A0A518AXR5_9BACT|nr:UDP-galactose-4-epimerase [Planctomycetes bacterium Pan216]
MDRERETVLITGSSGLLGRATALALAPNYRVIGLDNDIPETANGAETVKVDLTDSEEVTRAIQRVKEMSEGRLASVIHLAAYYDFSGEDSPLYDELTVNGTERLLQQLRQQAIDVEQFVFSSSLLVMKPTEPGIAMTELFPTQAEWPYPQSKLETEELLKRHHGDIPLVIHRIAGVYDEECHSIPISQQIKRIRERELESYVYPGNPNHGQSFVHREDVVACLVATVERRHDLDREEVFLIGEEDVVSYGEMQERLGEQIHGQEWPVIRIPKMVAKAGAWAKDNLPGTDDPFIKTWMIDLADAHYELDITKAKSHLRWTPKHSLRGMIAKMVANLERDPEAWYQRHGLEVPNAVAN